MHPTPLTRTAGLLLAVACASARAQSIPANDRIVEVVRSQSPSAMTAAPQLSATGVPAEPAAPPIDVVAVGYDVQGNARAQDMLQKMAAAATNAGGRGAVLLAGQDATELAGAMDKAVSTAIHVTQDAGKPALILRTDKVGPGERVVVQLAHPPPEPHAWIGFYRKGAGHRDYIKYNFVRDLDRNEYSDILAPDEPGLYNFRLFRDESYQPVVVSGDVAVQ